MFSEILKRLRRKHKPAPIDELTIIEQKRKVETDRIIRSMGRNSIIFPLTGRSYTPKLDNDYRDVVCRRLVNYMNAHDTDEIDMAIAPAIVGITRSKLESTLFIKQIPPKNDRIVGYYKPLVPGIEMRLRSSSSSIVRTPEI